MHAITIHVRNVGIHFGCEADVILRGHIIHTSRIYPYGMRGNAYSAAEAWATAAGYSVAQ